MAIPTETVDITCMTCLFSPAPVEITANGPGNWCCECDAPAITRRMSGGETLLVCARHEADYQHRAYDGAHSPGWLDENGDLLTD